MGTTGYCVSDDHENCPDTTGGDTCDCPCHLGYSEEQLQAVRDAMKR